MHSPNVDTSTGICHGRISQDVAWELLRVVLGRIPEPNWQKELRIPSRSSQEFLDIMRMISIHQSHRMIEAFAILLHFDRWESIFKRGKTK